MICCITPKGSFYNLRNHPRSCAPLSLAERGRGRGLASSKRANKWFRGLLFYEPSPRCFAPTLPARGRVKSLCDFFYYHFCAIEYNAIRSALLGNKRLAREPSPRRRSGSTAFPSIRNLSPSVDPGLRRDDVPACAGMTKHCREPFWKKTQVMEQSVFIYNPFYCGWSFLAAAINAVNSG